MPNNLNLNNSVSLVADIGGTNARFGLSSKGRLLADSVEILSCGDFANLDDAVRHYLRSQQVEIANACMAFACPVSGHQIQMTNNHWAFDKSEMKHRLNFKSLKIINDFTAQALALPVIPNKKEKDTHFFKNRGLDLNLGGQRENRDR